MTAPSEEQIARALDAIVAAVKAALSAPASAPSEEQIARELTVYVKIAEDHGRAMIDSLTLDKAEADAYARIQADNDRWNYLVQEWPLSLPALSAPASGEKWRPIHTAPKDGTCVLIDDDDGGDSTVAFYQAGQWLVRWNHDHYTDPVRWCPIPPRADIAQPHPAPESGGASSALNKHTDKSVPCPTCGFHVVRRERPAFVIGGDDVSGGASSAHDANAAPVCVGWTVLDELCRKPHMVDIGCGLIAADDLLADPPVRSSAPDAAQREARLRIRLSYAAKWFQQYADEHTVKGDTDKAARNQSRADYCRAALREGDI